MEVSNEILIHLKELSALMMDSINGFKHVSESVKEEELKNYFIKCERESSKIWDDLNFEIMLLRGEAKTNGTIKGAVNHLWMKIKIDIVHSELQSVLKNILLCEEYNINRYKQVLEEELPGPLKDKLDSHVAILDSRFKHLEQMASIK
jgi:uncharacterized protein (TIGR02284 family)